MPSDDGIPVSGDRVLKIEAGDAWLWLKIDGGVFKFSYNGAYWIDVPVPRGLERLPEERAGTMNAGPAMDIAVAHEVVGLSRARGEAHQPFPPYSTHDPTALAVLEHLPWYQVEKTRGDTFICRVSFDGDLATNQAVEAGFTLAQAVCRAALTAVRERKKKDG